MASVDEFCEADLFHASGDEGAAVAGSDSEDDATEEQTTCRLESDADADSAGPRGMEMMGASCLLPEYVHG